MTTGETQAIKCIVSILEPLAVMTDEFQSDEVTSSGVIIGFISAVQGTQPTKYFVINFNEYFLAFSDVNKAEIEEHLDFVKEITEFKKAVLDCLIVLQATIN